MARFKVFQQDNSYLFNVNTGIQYTVAFSKASYLLSQSAANPISLWELSFYYTESSPNIKRKVINAQILSDIRETIVQ